MPGLSLLHLADVHLGIPFRHLGIKGRATRQKLIENLETAAELALNKNLDLFLISGDLFDSEKTTRDVLNQISRILSRLYESGIKVILIPGNHDPWQPESPYRDAVFQKQGVAVLTPENQSTVFHELDTAICGWFPHPDRPEQWIKPADDWHQGKKYRIGMAHGPITIPGLNDFDMPPIPGNWIADSGLDYLALGHWHQFKDVSAGNVAAFYPGSIEMLALGQDDAGNVLLVNLNGQGQAQVQKHKVGRLKLEVLKLDAGELAAGRDLEQEIDSRADSEMFLDVLIEGRAVAGFEPDIEGLLERAQEKFLRLRIRDKSKLLLSPELINQIPDRSVAGEFVKIIQEKIEQADSDIERTELNQALRLGLGGLMGAEPE